MRTLRLGMIGDDVEAWEYFLRGQGYYWLEVDGDFDEASVDATRLYQADHGLEADGVVGKITMASAMQIGFDPLEDDNTEENGPNWPSPPSFKPLIGNDARAAVFGKFRYGPSGTSGNPEAITVLDGWVGDNIVSVEIPQLVGVQGTSKMKSFQFHKVAAPQIVAFFKAVEAAGLKDLLKTWGGSYSARFIRGSRVHLSNHSFGSAFDINVPWNFLGTQPALKGKNGSVRELVPIGYKFGLYWGGHFGRKDGMHFEVAKVMSEIEIRRALTI